MSFSYEMMSFSYEIMTFSFVLSVVSIHNVAVPGEVSAVKTSGTGLRLMETPIPADASAEQAETAVFA
jgi:hypothetical protein